MQAYSAPLPPHLPDSPDIIRLEPAPSIGIDEIRRVQAFLSRKPIHSSHNTVIIRQAEKLTLPAQHAFLKTLEEPPAGSQIFLVTAHPDSLLPTVLSRCTSVQDNKPVAGEPELSPTQHLLDQILSATAGQRLFLMESQKFTRDSALEFLDHLEYFLHQQIRSGSPVTINYSLLTETRKYLSANVSVRLALSHLFLNL